MLNPSLKKKLSKLLRKLTKKLLLRKNLGKRDKTLRKQERLKVNNGKSRPKLPKLKPSRKSPLRKLLKQYSLMTPRVRQRLRPLKSKLMLPHNNNNLLTPWLLASLA